MECLLPAPGWSRLFHVPLFGPYPSSTRAELLAVVVTAFMSGPIKVALDANTVFLRAERWAN
eukprot:8006375-Alexandrium_andersonii.AAC.1